MEGRREGCVLDKGRKEGRQKEKERKKEGGKVGRKENLLE